MIRYHLISITVLIIAVFTDFLFIIIFNNYILENIPNPKGLNIILFFDDFIINHKIGGDGRKILK